MDHDPMYKTAELDELDLDYVRAFDQPAYIRVIEARAVRLKHKLDDSESWRGFWLMLAMSSAAFNIALAVVLLIDSQGH